MPEMPFNNMAGYRRTNRYRIRNGLFGTVVEELIEHQDGSLRWRKSPTYQTFGIELRRD